MYEASRLRNNINFSPVAPRITTMQTQKRKKTSGKITFYRESFTRFQWVACIQCWVQGQNNLRGNDKCEAAPKVIIRKKREKGNTFFVSPEEITEVKEEFCASGGRDAVTVSFKVFVYL